MKTPAKGADGPSRPACPSAVRGSASPYGMEGSAHTRPLTQLRLYLSNSFTLFRFFFLHPREEHMQAFYSTGLGCRVSQSILSLCRIGVPLCEEVLSCAMPRMCHSYTSLKAHTHFPDTLFLTLCLSNCISNALNSLYIEGIILMGRSQRCVLLTSRTLEGADRSRASMSMSL